jgi:hypothetical protein
MLAALLFTAIYLGGAGADDCDDITFDKVGFAYLACHSSSENFTGADGKDMDAYVVKFDPRAERIVFASRIGGSKWDAAFRVVVDKHGAVWVSGTTQSSDFPFQGDASTGFRPGGINAFVARLDSNGAVEEMAVIGDATSEGLVITPENKVYMAGTKAPNDEHHYAYVAEIDGRRATRILNLGTGTATGVAIDRKGSLFAAGFNGRGAIVAKIDLSAWKVVASHSIGSGDADRARAIVVDRSGRPHVLGTVGSNDLPHRQRIAGKSDVFLAGLDAKLKRIRYLRLFGGTAEDMAGFNGASLRMDTQGKLWIAGQTRSVDLPARGQFAGVDDGFVASFPSDGGNPGFAAYLGGTGFELLEGLAVAPDGAVWATGITSSRGLAEPDHHGGKSDAILIRLDGAGKR